jgi:hypothetical protein
MAAFFPHRKRAEPGGKLEPTTTQATESDGHRLADVVTGLLRAFVEAHGAMDSASADLAKEYWRDPILRSLPLPAFTIPEVTVRLKVAVTDPSADDMRVVVNSKELERVPAHLISEIEFNLVPQSVSAFEHEPEGAATARG